MARACPAPAVLPPGLPAGPTELGRSAYVITHCTEQLLRARRYQYVSAKVLVSVLPTRWPDGTPLHLVLHDPNGYRFGVFRPAHGGLQCTACGTRCHQLGAAVEHAGGKRWLQGHIHGISDDIMSLSSRVQDLVQDEYLWQAGASRPVIAAPVTPVPASASAAKPTPKSESQRPLAFARASVARESSKTKTTAQRPPLPLDARVLKIRKALQDMQHARPELGIIASPAARSPDTMHMTELVESLCLERESQRVFMDHLGRVVSLCPARAAAAISSK